MNPAFLFGVLVFDILACRYCGNYGGNDRNNYSDDNDEQSAAQK